MTSRLKRNIGTNDGTQLRPDSSERNAVFTEDVLLTRKPPQTADSSLSRDSGVVREEPLSSSGYWKVIGPISYGVSDARTAAFGSELKAEKSWYQSLLVSRTRLTSRGCVN